MSFYKLSVVVCTYNRASLLEKCLKSLVSQSLSPQLYEIIVVNNNSSDDTKSVVEKFCFLHSNIRIITELKQGLSHARNRGWREAKGEYIAYIDDDAKAFPDWCEQIINFTKRKPEIKIFGGPYYPFTLNQPPEWFPKDYGKFEICGEEREIDVPREWICGSNMIYHCNIFRNVIFFDSKLGMNGNLIGYGEETQLILILVKKGYKIYYVPNIKVYHLIAAYKMHLSWLLKSSYVSGKSSNKVFSLQQSIWLYFFRLLKEFANSLRLYINYRNKPFKCRIFYSFRGFIYIFGGFMDKLNSK